MPKAEPRHIKQPFFTPPVEVPPLTGQAASEKTDRTLLITSADAVRSAI